MSIIAEFSFPMESFVLGAALESDGVSRIEFDCNLPNSNGTMPYFWAWGSQFCELETLPEDQPAVKEIKVVDELNDVRLYRAEWHSQIPHLLHAINESNSDIYTFAGETHWRIKLHFHAQSDVTTFTSCFSATGFSPELRNSYSLHKSLESHSMLTPAQRETLITAEKKGFYSEPREITMEEVAEELDISLAAVSGRLRRGTANLIKGSLC